jgi:hypothetical protein
MSRLPAVQCATRAVGEGASSAENPTLAVALLVAASLLRRRATSLLGLDRPRPQDSGPAAGCKGRAIAAAAESCSCRYDGRFDAKEKGQAGSRLAMDARILMRNR